MTAQEYIRFSCGSLLYLILIQFSAFSQALKYAPLRAGFCLEGAGIGTTAMASAEMPFHYKPGAFMNLQAGIGINGDPSQKISQSYSAGITYNFLLNPYRQRECSPFPGFRHLEFYLETGLAGTFEPGDGTVPQRRLVVNGHTTFGILGIRLHLVRRRRIYIFKARYTPLLNRGLEPWGGVSFGVGWRK